VADREDVGEGDDAARELVFGDEDAGEEVERQQQGVDDRRGGVLRGDRGGKGDAEAAEGGGADDEGEEDLRQWPRLRRPSSRAITRVIASVCIVAEMIESDIIAGT
jgi:hypothetical protein